MPQQGSEVELMKVDEACRMLPCVWATIFHAREILCCHRKVGRHSQSPSEKDLTFCTRSTPIPHRIDAFIHPLQAAFAKQGLT